MECGNVTHHSIDGVHPLYLGATLITNTSLLKDTEGEREKVVNYISVR